MNDFWMTTLHAAILAAVGLVGYYVRRSNAGIKRIILEFNGKSKGERHHGKLDSESD